jgi:hypothetical protein
MGQQLLVRPPQTQGTYVPPEQSALTGWKQKGWEAAQAFVDPQNEEGEQSVLNFLAALAGTGMLGIGMARRQPVAELTKRLTPDKSTPSIADAIRLLAERYPRLMSHVQGIDFAAPTLGPGTAGRVIPASKELGRREGDIARILLNPDELQYARSGEVVDTVAHEATHVAQMLRWQDRAKRGQVSRPFQRDYASKSRDVGYLDNPYEVRAREGGYRVALEHIAEQIDGPGKHSWPRPKARALARSEDPYKAYAEIQRMSKQGDKAANARIPTKWPELPDGSNERGIAELIAAKGDVGEQMARRWYSGLGEENLERAIAKAKDAIARAQR